MTFSKEHKRVTRRESDMLVLVHLEQLGSPRALAVWMMYKYGEHRQLVSLQYDFARECHWPEDFAGFIQRCTRDYGATKYLSKCSSLNTGIDTREVAIESARAAELINKTTNAIFECAEEGREATFLATRSSVMSDLNPAIFAARQIIARILGELKPGILADHGFSSGRTTSAFGDEKTLVHKYTSRLDVTPRSLQIALRVFGDSPHWGQAALDADGPCSMLYRAFELVPGNVMTVVPKNAKTDRVICYEPHCNIRLQLAVGTYLKRRLLLNGVNLSDQSVNQRRALLASKFGHLATLDLSAASDTITTGAVKSLLPEEWYDLLCALRSPYTKWPDGRTIENEKFSSMGNGFTFELESLIFYALASSVSQNVSVYGDDIICPTDRYDDIVSVLTRFGFKVNDQKSFSSGPFRESCGCDALLGVDITPFYLRVLPTERLDVVKLHNGLRLYYARCIPTRVSAAILRRIRANHSFHLGPSHYNGERLGDGHYHANFDEACPTKAGFGLDGWWYNSTYAVSRVNRHYGDRVEGRFSGQFSAAALCAALGPKKAKSVFDILLDRRESKLKTKRTLASFAWPDVMWV